MTDSGTDIGAPMHARREHDPFCPGSTNECICVSLGRVRADEAERVLGNDYAWVVNAAMADLRARVQALPDLGHQIGAIVGYRIEGEWLHRSDVLALIDGASDD